MMKDADKDVQLICCADKLSNIKSIYADKLIVGEAVFDRFNASKEDTRWYYESLANAFTKIDDYKMKQDITYFINKTFNE